jgi:hypothetical protein
VTKPIGRDGSSINTASAWGPCPLACEGRLLVHRWTPTHPLRAPLAPGPKPSLRCTTQRSTRPPPCKAVAGRSTCRADECAPCGTATRDRVSSRPPTRWTPCSPSTRPPDIGDPSCTASCPRVRSALAGVERTRACLQVADPCPRPKPRRHPGHPLYRLSRRCHPDPRARSAAARSPDRCSRQTRPRRAGRLESLVIVRL